MLFRHPDSSGAPMNPERTHVVVVNDNPDFLQLMADLLHDERYPTTVIDGDRDEAVDLIRAAEPDVLIIDLRLGRDELHGWDVMQEVRSDAKLRELPILICTGDLVALAKLTDVVAAMPRVATLTKPFSIDDLFATLQTLAAREPA
jgi:two-component system, response regulator PdtaR